MRGTTILNGYRGATEHASPYTDWNSLNEHGWTLEASMGDYNGMSIDDALEALGLKLSDFTGYEALVSTSFP